MKHDWQQAFGLQHEEKKDHFDRPLVKTLFPVGGFLVALIGLLTGSNKLPWWALVVLVFFVAVCAGVLLWPIVQWSAQKWRDRRTRSRAARLFYADVDQAIRRLSDQLDNSTTHTLTYELRDFFSIRDKSGNVVIGNMAEGINIKEWLALIGRKANTRRARDFVEVVAAVSLAASQYRRLCESLQNHLQYVVNQNLLDEPQLKKLKNAWNSSRDSYMVVMQDWGKTCDKINNEFGEYIAHPNYPPLRTLE